jgi:hypothetical protein
MDSEKTKTEVEAPKALKSFEEIWMKNKIERDKEWEALKLRQENFKTMYSVSTCKKKQ